MGWNSWNTFRCDINERLVREVAAALVNTGLRDAGYVYVNIDDCWMSHRDEITGRIVPFQDKFPSGMKALGDHLHALGLKFGVYSDSGNKTCEGYPGSFGFETIDAQTYAEWGVDYLKYDFCNMNNGESERHAYSRMRDALNATGRPILYSLCSWGGGSPHLWGQSVGNSWRTSPDLFAVWDRTAADKLRLPSFLISVSESVERAAGLSLHAGPGGFNDPDMLVVGLDRGMYPYGIVQRCPEHVQDCKPGQYITREQWGLVGGLTQDEQRTHFSLWCIMSSPLILGNDPRAVSQRALAILKATEVIAVNQDPRGLQARRVQRGDHEMWAKALADGSVAVLMVNRAEEPRDLPLNLEMAWNGATRHGHGGGGAKARQGAAECVDTHDSRACEEWAAAGECEKNPGFMHNECKFSCGKCTSTRLSAVSVRVRGSGGKGEDTLTFAVRDLWLREELGEHSKAFMARNVAPHASVMLRITSLAESKPREDGYGSDDPQQLLTMTNEDEGFRRPRGHSSSRLDIGEDRFDAEEEDEDALGGLVRDGDGRVIGGVPVLFTVFGGGAGTVLFMLETAVLVLVWAVPELRRAVGMRLLRGLPPGPKPTSSLL